MEITTLDQPHENNLFLYRLVFTQLPDEDYLNLPHDIAIVEAISNSHAVEVLESYLGYKVQLIECATIYRTFTPGVKLHFTGSYELIASTTYSVYRRSKERSYVNSYLPVHVSEEDVSHQTKAKERDSQLYFVNLEGKSALLIEARNKDHVFSLLMDYLYPLYAAIEEMIELNVCGIQRVIVYVNNRV